MKTQKEDDAMENHVPINSITLGQVGKLLELLGPALRKSGLQSIPSQQVLENQGSQVVSEMVAVFRRHVEAVSSMTVRHATVNRNRTPQEAIDATGRNKYLINDVVAIMPQGEGDEAEVFFFKPDASAYDKNGNISDDEVSKQFELRGLKPAEPYAFAAVNEADPAFADEHPNGTHWKDADGNWCYIAFNSWSAERNVSVGRGNGKWSGGWWFAGCRK
ncbi:MAG: hypothetical protein HZB10_00625 [Candidatus Yonathbacteria bacterium]|nr:hypothetical protein [Candidatus Yonathbacteria bacterium]